MKTIFNYLKFAVLTAGVACVLTSCEKNNNGDDDNLPGIDISALKITIDGDLCYYYDDSYPANVGVYSTKTKSFGKRNFITDGTSIAAPYGIGVDPITKEVYVSDADDYMTPSVVYIFDANGKKQRTLNVGINPCGFAFKEGTGVFILSEGTWGGNNSTISFYDFKSKETKFDIANGKLGSGAMDILIHGGKIYITVSTSGTIAVLGVASKEIIKTIEVKDGAGQSREPHYLTANAGKVYATTFDGNVVRIDTTSLNIDGITAVGNNPEGIAYAKGKLYVANTNGLDYSNIDNTLSVIDINKFQEESRITVGENPYILKSDNNGNIFITCRSVWKSDWSGIETPGRFQYLNIQTGKVTTIQDITTLQ
ncbi:MAG: hypothetical protein LBI82_06020 [Dysgonamonadaceae bacterium]|jgi:DNA-binding beta-propeller fold protein YncE|nr:hypothetical protein [Dysgonamonadaceae bacterium]